MADDTPKEERVFEPTMRRREEFREEGRVAVSKDMASTAQLVAILTGFMFMGNLLLGSMAGAITWVLQRLGDDGGDGLTFPAAVVQSLDLLVLPTLTLSIFFGLAAVVATVAQTGFLFSTKSLGFKLDRIKPLQKLIDLFGPKKATVQVGLALAKAGLTGFVLTMALAEIMPALSQLGRTDMANVNAVVRGELRHLLVITVLILAVLATVDWVWQRSQLMQKMRMTRDEVKRENEQQEGKPEIKAQRRRRHRELSMNQIIQTVPGADVIVTNPTHYAVALRYKPGKDAAPTVVAKGIDDMAAHIRTIARRHGVPIIENRALARALHATVRVGKQVPQDLFTQVAQVLARVYAMKRGRSSPPNVPSRPSPLQRNAPRGRR